MTEDILKNLHYGNILEDKRNKNIYVFLEEDKDKKGYYLLAKIIARIPSYIKDKKNILKYYMNSHKVEYEENFNIADLIAWFEPVGIISFITPHYEEIYLAQDLEELFLIDSSVIPEKIIPFKPLSYGSDEYHFVFINEKNRKQTYHICEFAEFMYKNNLKLMNLEELLKKYGI